MHRLDVYALPAMHNPFALTAAIKGALRLTGFVIMLALLMPVHMIYTRWLSGDPYTLSLRFYKLLAKLLGLHIRTHGQMAAARPTLFVANHTSYLDILVLGAVLPASFVAKAEVARWPVIGAIASMQRTVFVERRAQRAKEQNNELTQRLAMGDSIILFPEGTSSDGTRVLPFKSSLFSVAEAPLPQGDLKIQPVSITCTGVDGLPLRRALRSLYAWYGDMTLPGHVWQVVQQGFLTIDIVFHQPVTLPDLGDRKKLAEYCHHQIAAGVEVLNTGRWRPDHPLLTVAPQKQLAAAAIDLA